jgi:hypothetical protein
MTNQRKQIEYSLLSKRKKGGLYFW